MSSCNYTCSQTVGDLSKYTPPPWLSYSLVAYSPWYRQRSSVLQQGRRARTTSRSGKMGRHKTKSIEATHACVPTHSELLRTQRYTVLAYISSIVIGAATLCYIVYYDLQNILFRETVALLLALVYLAVWLAVIRYHIPLEGQEMRHWLSIAVGITLSVLRSFDLIIARRGTAFV